MLGRKCTNNQDLSYKSVLFVLFNPLIFIYSLHTLSIFKRKLSYSLVLKLKQLSLKQPIKIRNI